MAGFYNLENLFGTIDTEGVFNKEFSPGGERNGMHSATRQKLFKIARYFF